MDNFTNTCLLMGNEVRLEFLLTQSIGGVLASLVCLLALILVLWFKLYNYFSHRLASYQVLSSLFFSVIISAEMVSVNYYSNQEIYKPPCEGIGFLLEYAVWLKILFMMWLTLQLFCFTVCCKSSEKKEVLIVICLLLIPFLFIWVPFINQGYGLSTTMCWIRIWKEDCIGEKLIVGYIERYALLYIPVICILFGATILLISMMLFMACHSPKLHTAAAHDQLLLVDNRRRRKALKELLPLVIYPIVMLVFFTAAFIMNIYDDIAGSDTINHDIINTINRTAFMDLSAVVNSFPSLLSGLTLLIHIIVLKCPKIKFLHIRQNCNKEMDNPSCQEHQVTEYGTCTLGSTNCRTHFSIPFESEVDNAFLAREAARMV